MKEHARCADEGGGGEHRRRRLLSDCAREIIMAHYFFAKPRPDTKSQYRPRFRRGLGSKYLRIMWEYGLVTAIVFRPLTHPHTCEMGSLGFSAMSPLKFKRMYRASFPSIPSTERTNGGKCLCCSWKLLPCLSLFSLYK